MKKSKTYPTLSRPPIIEALFDIRVKLAEFPNLQALDKLHEKVKKDFPDKKTRGITKFTIGNKDGQPFTAAPENSVNGYICFSADQKKAVQFRSDGFTYSYLKSYKSWDLIRPESEKLWNLYAATVKPIALERLAVRYINSIKVPQTSGDYEKYFKLPSKLPSDIEGSVKQFLNMFVVGFEDGVQANITLASKPSEEPGLAEFVFDIDVFKEVNNQSIDIWKTFDYFKEVKNEVFFGFLTQETIGLFL